MHEWPFNLSWCIIVAHKLWNFRIDLLNVWSMSKLSKIPLLLLMWYASVEIFIDKSKWKKKIKGKVSPKHSWSRLKKNKVSYLPLQTFTICYFPSMSHTSVTSSGKKMQNHNGRKRIYPRKNSKDKSEKLLFIRNFNWTHLYLVSATLEILLKILRPPSAVSKFIDLDYSP